MARTTPKPSSEVRMQSISIGDRLQESGRKSAVRLERLKRAASQSQPQVSFTPEINSNSQVLVSHMRAHINEKVEDRLLRLGRRIQAVRQAKMEQILQNPSGPASQEAIERLLQYQQIYRDHKVLLAQRNQTERPTFTPEMNQMSERIMASKGKLDVTRPKTSPKQGMAYVPEFPFAPQVNRRSSEIAAKLGSPTLRLLSPKTEVKAVPGFSFRPQTNHPSRNGTQGSPRWEELYKLNNKRLEERAQARFKSDQERPAECSFRPNINSGLPETQSAKVVVDRLLKWGKEKITKLKQVQSEQSDPALEECTFAPSVRAMQIFSSSEWMLPPEAMSVNWLSNSNLAPSVKSLTPSHIYATSPSPRQLIEDFHLDTKETIPQTTDEDSADLTKLLKQLRGV